MNGKTAGAPGRVILLAGNPNSGKTSVFNWMAGAHQHVGNYPGVTVEKKSAVFTRGKTRIELVDLPGVYSLLAASPEESIARDEILSGSADVVIQVMDGVKKAGIEKLGMVTDPAGPERVTDVAIPRRNK